MHFYQNKRYVPKFDGLTPLEYRKKLHKKAPRKLGA
ncbi:hypothetical protein ACLSC0_002898 [Listeria monocytogenes]